MKTTGGRGVFVLPGPLLGTILRCGDTGDIYLVLIMERVELSEVMCRLASKASKFFKLL